MHVMGLRNVTYLFLKFLMVKMDPLNDVSLEVAVCNNVITKLNENLYTQTNRIWRRKVQKYLYKFSKICYIFLIIAYCHRVIF
jgi:hypothetical protein